MNTSTTTQVFPTCVFYQEDSIVTSTLVEVKTVTEVPFDESVFENSDEFLKYGATTSYASAVFYTNKSNQDVLYIKVIFGDVSSISGIHIHTNNDGQSGPILVWLGTSVEWDSGITQNTPLTNYPCRKESCQEMNKNDMCTLTAPLGTPSTNELSFSTKKYIVKKNVCDSCPWISNGTRFDVHGKDFQQYIDCQIIGETPGIDMLESALFEKL